MYRQNRWFRPPNGRDNSIIWRYMDFTKFVSMLDRKELFFATIEKLSESDALEGLYSTPTIEHYMSRRENEGAPRSELAEIEETRIGSIQLRKHRAVNSWHIADHESAAMWSIYAKNDAGIAIQSTFGRLKESFKCASEDIWIGVIEYLDYRNDVVRGARDIAPIIHKRKSFEYEQELRAVLARDPDPSEPPDSDTFDPDLGGSYVCVDLDILIERIYVSPMAPKWFEQIVRSIIAKYDLEHKEVVRSDLARGNVY